MLIPNYLEIVCVGYIKSDITELNYPYLVLYFTPIGGWSLFPISIPKTGFWILLSQI